MAKRFDNELAKRTDRDRVRVEAEQVRAMMDTEGWKHLQAAIARRRDAVVEGLEQSGDSGRILDHAEYARLMGYLAGLRQSQDAADSFVTALEKHRARNPESPE